MGCHFLQARLVTAYTASAGLEGTVIASAFQRVFEAGRGFFVRPSAFRGDDYACQHRRWSTPDTAARLGIVDEI
jgi:hypothetical protein